MQGYFRALVLGASAFSHLLLQDRILQRNQQLYGVKLNGVLYVLATAPHLLQLYKVQLLPPWLTGAQPVGSLAWGRKINFITMTLSRLKLLRPLNLAFW